MIEQDSMSERRLVNRLKNYWDGLKAEQQFPLYSQFNQNNITDMWDNCLNFEVSYTSGKKKIYHCKFVGNNLQQAFGKELKDRYISSFDKRIFPGSNLLESLDNSVDDKVFVLSAGQFVNHDNKIVKFRDCVMPFGNFEGNICNLIIGISWKAF